MEKTLIAKIIKEAGLGDVSLLGLVGKRFSFTANKAGVGTITGTITGTAFDEQKSALHLTIVPVFIPLVGEGYIQGEILTWSSQNGWDMSLYEKNSSKPKIRLMGSIAVT